MAFSTYAELQTLVGNYLARDDLSTQIVDFIKLGEVRMRRDLRLRQMLTSTDLTVSTTDVAIPSDFLELRELHIDSNPITQLDYLPPTTFFRTARTTENGKPVFYTMDGTNFKFGPQPDTTYTGKLLYYAAPDFLSDSNNSNTFLTVAPDCLLYAALGESEPFLMNDQRLAVWANLYQRAITQLTSADDRGEFSGNPMSMSVN